VSQTHAPFCKRKRKKIEKLGESHSGTLPRANTADKQVNKNKKKEWHSAE